VFGTPNNDGQPNRGFGCSHYHHEKKTNTCPLRHATAPRSDERQIHSFNISSIDMKMLMMLR